MCCFVISFGRHQANRGLGWVGSADAYMIPFIVSGSFSRTVSFFPLSFSSFELVQIYLQSMVDSSCSL